MSMDMHIRPMVSGDIKCVEAIERQAFPTLWPPTPFKREMDNRMAKYLVAWEPDLALVPAVDGHASATQDGSGSHSLLRNLLAGLKGERVPAAAKVQPIRGFVGLWFMVGDAHITAIAVEEASRGKGIGELLLVGSIELAMQRDATEMSLEARVSNHVAQSLYTKYGFRKVGIRRAYYTDDREDAVIMTTEPINTPSYREEFRAMREAFQGRHGEIRIALS